MTPVTSVMPEYRIVFCTVPVDYANTLATELVTQRKASCVNILPQVQSVYQWQGSVEQDNEALLIIKTTQAAYPALERFISDNHPYDTPEIIAMPVTEGLPAYLTWLAESIQPTAS